MQESKTTGRMRAEDRKELILSKACHLFYQYGYDAVTTKQLAQEVGCSEGLLFRHFASKNDIYLALMKEWEDSVTQPVELPIVDGSALKTLEKMYQDVVVNRSWNKNAKIRKNLEVAVLSRTSMAAEHNRIMKKCSNLLTETVLPLIKQGQTAGEIKDGDPVELGMLFLAAVWGMMTLRKDFGNQYRPYIPEKIAETILAKR